MAHFVFSISILLVFAKVAKAETEGCEQIRLQSLLRSGLIDQPQLFVRNQLNSPGSDQFKGTQRSAQTGISIDLAELWKRVEEREADDLECKAQILREALRKNGPDLLARAEMAGINARLEWNASEERRLAAELDVVLKRIRIGKDSLLNREKLAQALFQIRNHMRTLKMKLVQLEAQLLSSDADLSTIASQDFSNLLNQYQISLAKAQISRAKATRDNWSFKISAGVSTESDRPLASNDADRNRFVEAQLSIPIFGPALRPLMTTSANDLASSIATDSSNESMELHRFRSIESEIQTTLKLMNDELTEHLQRERELLEILQTVNIAGGESIQTSYYQLAGQLREIQEHSLYLKAKIAAISGTSPLTESKSSQEIDKKFKDVQLEPTSGDYAAEGNGFAVSQSPTFRAKSISNSDSNSFHSQIIRLEFDSAQALNEAQALESGEIRHQFGLFFRARDQCNLIYVMLRIDKTGNATDAAELSVQEKKNPGKSMHQDCANNGYRNLSSSSNSKRVKLSSTSINQLELHDTGKDFVVWLNGERVWQHDAEEFSRPADGYIGVRSDNIKWRFKLSQVR
jgi:hypothetical protein